MSTELRPRDASCRIPLGCPCLGRLQGKAPMVLFKGKQWLFPLPGALEQQKSAYVFEGNLLKQCSQSRCAVQSYTL